MTEKSKKKKLDQLESEIRKIYGDKKGEQKIFHPKSHHIRNILFGITLFLATLAGVTYAGFHFFSTNEKTFTAESIDLTFDGPRNAKSGETVTYILRYKNNERVPLANARLTLRLPSTFHAQHISPQFQDNEIHIGAIGVGKEGEVTLRGVFLEAQEVTVDLQAILTYRPGNFNAEFQKVTTTPVRMEGSVLELTIDGPKKVFTGDKVLYTMTLKNNSTNTFSDIRIKTTFSESLLPSSAIPASFEDRFALWLIPALAEQSEYVITLYGSIAVSAQDILNITAEAGWADETGAIKTQTTALYTTEITKGDFDLSLFLNGKSENSTVQFGDTLRFAATWKNAGKTKVENVSLSTRFEESPKNILLWNDLEDKARGTKQGDTLTWTKRHIPTLSKIEPQSEGAVHFTIPINKEPSIRSENEPHRITIFLEMNIDDGKSTTGRIINARPITVTVISDTTIQTEVEKINDDNEYDINITITNSIHDLKDLQLTIPLPDNIIWKGKEDLDAGEIRYEQRSKSVVWSLNWIPTDIQTLFISFRVKNNSSQEEELKNIENTIIFEATDQTVNERFTIK